MLTEQRRELAHVLLFHLQMRTRPPSLPAMCHERGLTLLGSTSGREPADGRVWFRISAEDEHGVFELGFRIGDDRSVIAHVDDAPLLQREVWA